MIRRVAANLRAFSGRMPFRLLILLIAAPLTLTLHGSARAATAEQCAAAKLKAAGNEIKGKMDCYAGPYAGEQECVSARQTTADSRINILDGECDGPAIAIDAAIDTCVCAFRIDDRYTHAAGCSRISARAIGSGAKAALVCQAKEITKPGTFAACDAAADAKTTARLQHAEQNIDGCNPLVEQTAVLVDVETCASAVTGIVMGRPLPPMYGFVTQWSSSGVALAVDGAGNVFAASEFGNRVEKFANDGTLITAWNPLTGSGTWGLAADGNGDLFLAVNNGVEGTVKKFTTDGTFLTDVGSAGSGPGQFNLPFAVAVDGSGNVFVADIGDGQHGSRVQKFTNDGAYVTGWPACPPSTFCSSYGIAVDASGNVFVAVYGYATDGPLAEGIRKFTSDGTLVTAWGMQGTGNGEFDHPGYIAVDATGNVFVADISNSRIQKFTNDGSFLTRWGCPGSGDGQFLSSTAYTVTGIAVDSTGDVFVADPGNSRIEKFAMP